MRIFELLNFQHLVLYVFPTLAFIVLFWVALGYSHLKGKDDEARKTEIYGTYPDGLQDREAPFPLFLILVIAGTFIWGFFYILGYGLLGVRI